MFKKAGKVKKEPLDIDITSLLDIGSRQICLVKLKVGSKSYGVLRLHGATLESAPATAGIKRSPHPKTTTSFIRLDSCYSLKSLFL